MWEIFIFLGELTRSRTGNLTRSYILAPLFVRRDVRQKMPGLTRYTPRYFLFCFLHPIKGHLQFCSLFFSATEFPHFCSWIFVLLFAIKISLSQEFQNSVFFANWNSSKNIQLLDKISYVFVFAFMLSLEIFCTCFSDIFLSSGPRFGLATAFHSDTWSARRLEKTKETSYSSSCYKYNT